MSKEKFLAKGVARKYENGEVLFNVESLHEHYEGIKYHETDILDGGFIRPNDVLDGDIREIEAKVEEEQVVLSDEIFDVDMSAGFPIGFNPPLEETEVTETVEDKIVWFGSTFPETTTKEIAVVSEVVSVDETPSETVIIEEVLEPVVEAPVAKEVKTNESEKQ